MVEHFNLWFWGSGGYEFMGGMVEMFLGLGLFAGAAALIAHLFS